jgi:hypothetical protein
LDLAWQLDQLQSHHQRPAIGGRQLQPPRLVIAPVRLVGNKLELDVPDTLARARANFPAIVAIDVAFKLPNGRCVIAELENLPSEVISVDPARLPSWLQEWDGPCG